LVDRKRFVLTPTSAIAPGFGVTLSGVSARHPAAAASAPAAIASIDVTIAPGEHVALIGPSGAGKTTLLQVLGLSMRPHDGSIALADQDPWALSTRALQRQRQQIFYAPQTPPLPPRQRVVTALLAARLPVQSLIQSLITLVYPQDAASAQAALAQFDLEDKLWERVDRLSGGERQRVGLARSLISPAKLWLVDEPLSALDPTRARQAISVLTRAARDRGATLITTLHQVDVATREFPRVIGLRDGRVAFDLPSEQVTADRLAELYAQHEYELAQIGQRVGPMSDAASKISGAVSDNVFVDTPASPQPAKIVHCR
jgi:phosphonate transport system ATP-binding protein